MPACLDECERLIVDGFDRRTTASKNGAAGIVGWRQEEKYMRPSVTSLLLFATFHLYAVTQTTLPVHDHTTMSMGGAVIDGAVHPELIPDMTAYRLWLLMVSKPSAPTMSQFKRQSSELARTRLKNSDLTFLITILADFNEKYRALIDNYNSDATAKLARGEKPDVSSMRLQRDLLVQSTHDRIKAALSAEGWSQLDGHVQNEKRRMKINVQGGAQ